MKSNKVYSRNQNDHLENLYSQVKTYEIPGVIFFITIYVITSEGKLAELCSEIPSDLLLNNQSSCLRSGARLWREFHKIFHFLLNSNKLYKRQTLMNPVLVNFSFNFEFVWLLIDEMIEIEYFAH